MSASYRGVPYIEVASAADVWMCPMTLSAVPVEEVRAVLVDVAGAQSWPANAFAYGDVDEPVTDLLLYRDPSRSFGTPTIARCEEAVEALANATGWTAAPQRLPRAGIVIGLGLRRGYHRGAEQHQPLEVIDRLAAIAAGWTCRAARLISARRVGSVVRDYLEVGAVLHGDNALLPAVAELADTFAQHRFTVTDLTHRRTFVLENTFRRLPNGARREVL